MRECVAPADLLREGGGCLTDIETLTNYIGKITSYAPEHETIDAA